MNFRLLKYSVIMGVLSCIQYMSIFGTPETPIGGVNNETSDPFYDRFGISERIIDKKAVIPELADDEIKQLIRSLELRKEGNNVVGEGIGNKVNALKRIFQRVPEGRADLEKNEDGGANDDRRKELIADLCLAHAAFKELRKRADQTACLYQARIEEIERALNQ